MRNFKFIFLAFALVIAVRSFAENLKIPQNPDKPWNVGDLVCAKYEGGATRCGKVSQINGDEVEVAQELDTSSVEVLEKSSAVAQGVKASAAAKSAKPKSKTAKKGKEPKESKEAKNETPPKDETPSPEMKKAMKDAVKEVLDEERANNQFGPFADGICHDASGQLCFTTGRGICSEDISALASEELKVDPAAESKKYEVSGGLGLGFNYYFGLIEAEKVLNTRWTVGVMPIFVLGKSYDNQVTVYGGFLNARFSLLRKRTGPHLQAGVGIYRISSTTEGASASATILAPALQVGWRFPVFGRVLMGAYAGGQYATQLSSSTSIDFKGILPFFKLSLSYGF